MHLALLKHQPMWSEFVHSVGMMSLDIQQHPKGIIFHGFWVQQSLREQGLGTLRPHFEGALDVEGDFQGIVQRLEQSLL